jgi:hypothetical protein
MKELYCRGCVIKVVPRFVRYGTYVLKRGPSRLPFPRMTGHASDAGRKRPIAAHGGAGTTPPPPTQRNEILFSVGGGYCYHAVTIRRNTSCDVPRVTTIRSDNGPYMARALTGRLSEPITVLVFTEYKIVIA